MQRITKATIVVKGFPFRKKYIGHEVAVLEGHVEFDVPDTESEMRKPSGDYYTIGMAIPLCRVIKVEEIY